MGEIIFLPYILQFEFDLFLQSNKKFSHTRFLCDSSSNYITAPRCSSEGYATVWHWVVLYNVFFCLTCLQLAPLWGDSAVLPACHRPSVGKGRPWSVAQEAWNGCMVGPSSQSEKWSFFYQFWVQSGIQDHTDWRVKLPKDSWSSWCAFFPLCQILHHYKCGCLSSLWLPWHKFLCSFCRLFLSHCLFPTSPSLLFHDKL